MDETENVTMTIASDRLGHKNCIIDQNSVVRDPEDKAVSPRILSGAWHGKRARKRIRRSSGQSRSVSTQVWILCILLSLVCAEKTAGTVSSSTSAAAPRSSLTKTSEGSNNFEKSGDDAAVVVVSNVLQITETEVWDGSKWKSGESRWTTQQAADYQHHPAGGRKSKGGSNKSVRIGSATSIKDGQPCASPDKQEPLEDMKFDGDWKIVTGGSSRDSYGWEYTVAQPFPVRQRVWLRNLVPVEPKPKKEIFKISRKKKKPDDKLAVRQRAKRKLPRWIRAVTDDYNFKGFGLSFYKSLVFAESFGVAFRIPLTYNFGRWETNRGLPSVSSSIGLFFPGTAMIAISTSVKLEFLKWISGRMVETTLYLLVASFWTFVRGVALALSAIAFPVTRKLYQPPVPMKAPWARPQAPIYSRTIEERLGCSVSWRLSRTRGYHFRVSYWHYYAPTLASLWPAVQAFASFFKDQDKSTMPDWWARRSAAFGLSTSGPIPDPPHVTSSLAMSLSGYYFRPAQAVRLVASPTLSSSPLKSLSSSKQQLGESNMRETASRKKMSLPLYDKSPVAGESEFSESDDAETESSSDSEEVDEGEPRRSKKSYT